RRDRCTRTEYCRGENRFFPTLHLCSPATRSVSSPRLFRSRQELSPCPPARYTSAPVQTATGDCAGTGGADLRSSAEIASAGVRGGKARSAALLHPLYSHFPCAPLPGASRGPSPCRRGSRLEIRACASPTA